MKKTIMIKKNYEFKHLFSKGKFYYGEYIHMYIKETNQDTNKLGIAVSKKQGKAVKRNHIKRLIRENYKNLEMKMKTGKIQLSSDESPICGDCLKEITDEYGNRSIILSDGMGTGGRAAIDSAMASAVM